MNILQNIKSWFSKKPKVAGEETLSNSEELVKSIDQDAVDREKYGDAEIADSAQLDALNELQVKLKAEEVATYTNPVNKGLEHLNVLFAPFKTEWNLPQSFTTEELVKLKSWREENTKIAKQLLDEYGEALTLFFDGSLEAHVTLLSFQDAGFVPRVYCLSITDSAQLGYEANLISWYVNGDFKIRLIEMNKESFWNNALKPIADEHMMISSLEAIKLWATTAAGGVPVIAGNIPYLERHEAWYQGDHEQYFKVIQKAKDGESSFIPSFILYSKEQTMSLLGELTKFLDENEETTSLFAVARFVKSVYPEIDTNKCFNAPSYRALSDYVDFEERQRKEIQGGISICWHKVLPLQDILS